jgi:hypothetical protein
MAKITNPPSMYSSLKSRRDPQQIAAAFFIGAGIFVKSGLRFGHGAEETGNDS